MLESPYRLWNADVSSAGCRPARYASFPLQSSSNLQLMGVPLIPNCKYSQIQINLDPPVFSVCCCSKLLNSNWLVQEVLQALAAGRVAELAQRLRLDLTDTLSRDVELLSDFLQCARPSVDQPETQLDDLTLTVGQ